MCRELTPLARINLEKCSPAQQEVWFKRLFASLRLLRFSQFGEAGSTAPSAAASQPDQAAQLEVLDILAEPDGWTRLCALGAGTYETALHRLRAMALMKCTLAISSDEYVKRFCTEYDRFSEPANIQHNWLPLLLSLRQALKASPLLEKKEVPLERASKQRERSSSKPIQYPPIFSSWREPIIAFGSTFALIFICFAIMFGSTGWILSQTKQRTQTASVQNRAVTQSLSVPSALQTMPTLPAPTPSALPTPNDAATTTATPTPGVVPTPVQTPTPVEASTEQAGFFVIGLATREEANAQAEAQKRRQEGLNPRVVFSSHWSGLTPNYYQVVYGVFAQRADTVALRNDLEQRGIKTYVMHSGQPVRP